MWLHDCVVKPPYIASESRIPVQLKMYNIFRILWSHYLDMYTWINGIAFLVNNYTTEFTMHTRLYNIYTFTVLWLLCFVHVVIGGFVIKDWEWKDTQMKTFIWWWVELSMALLFISMLLTFLSGYVEKKTVIAIE